SPVTRLPVICTVAPVSSVSSVSPTTTADVTALAASFSVTASAAASTLVSVGAASGRMTSEPATRAIRASSGSVRTTFVTAEPVFVIETVYRTVSPGSALPSPSTSVSTAATSVAVIVVPAGPAVGATGVVDATQPLPGVPAALP